MGHAQLLLRAFLLAIGALEAGIFWMLPEWERPALFFAITVAPEFRESREARGILRRYRIEAATLATIGWALILSGSSPKRWPLLIMGFVWLLVGPIVAFLIAREAVKLHSAEPAFVREATLAPRAAHLPGGWLLQAGPFAILGATALYLYSHWNRIPGVFPTHWGIDGQPNGWTLRTPVEVFEPLVLGAAIVAGLALLTYGALREARVVRVPGSRSAKRDFPHQMGCFLVGLEFFLATVLSSTALLPLTGPPNIAFVLIGTIVVIAAVFVASHWLNQARAYPIDPVASPAAEGIFGDGTLDERWKFGVFYYNPDDAALLVEKRFGIGYTLNFAHVLSWLIIALVAAVPLALALAALFRPG